MLELGRNWMPLIDFCMKLQAEYTFFFLGISEMGVSKNRGTPKSSILIGFSMK